MFAGSHEHKRMVEFEIPARDAHQADLRFLGSFGALSQKCEGGRAVIPQPADRQDEEKNNP